MARQRRHIANGLDAWPGYVDALSTLLMVIIFVLLVFVLAQAFLTATLAGRTDSLAEVNARLAQLTNAFSLEQQDNATLRQSVAGLNKDLASAAATRDTLTAQIAALTRTVGANRAELDAKAADIARLSAELEKIVRADRATIETKLAEIAKLDQQGRALQALIAELEKKAQTAAAASLIEQEKRAALQALLTEEKNLRDSARAQIALLNQQVEELRAQFASVQSALGLAEQKVRDRDLEITNLDAKLNAALVEKVEELKAYRSEFFGKLKVLLAGRPGIQIIGDRFVFQSEVLFPVGKSDLTPAGVAQMTTLAITIKDIAATIPPDVHWILRVDGHTDPQPLRGGSFMSNWELSAARAISVVKLLIVFGVPPEHLAATGFGEHQPFGPGDTEDAFAKDRRIELRLTDR